MTGERVLVGLSGGVDSSVAAALLVEQGYDVSGAMLRLWVEPGPCEGDPCADRCCTPEGVDRAQQVADRLGIPFYLLDAEELFKSRVVDYFVAEYAAGRTPNPCIPCNRFVRFGFLLRQALAMGATFLSTGHYARVQKEAGRRQLLRGRDIGKDQSYFLYALDQEQLSHVLFPLGELTKEEVRRIARRRDLPVVEQPESQDLCFVVGGDYRDFLRRQAPHLCRPGPIRDMTGRVVGQHQGLPAYTVGQRKGLGVAASQPLYVLALDADENALVIGPADGLEQDECLIQDVHYIDGASPGVTFQARAQIRYRASPTVVTVTALSNGTSRVRFASPIRGVTPGQSLVLYDGDVVLGGGIICKARQPVL
ncbi:MAG TPA: tRNA 2-thiouridine(34) synthase MnmA [Chloroflexi bacterium]|nr:tRNA 2-thiouridine(34) synthase MnmA [Chloroflexota bacterium]